MGQQLRREVAPRGEAAAILKLRIDELREELARKFSEHLSAAGEKKTAIPALSLHRRTAPIACIPTTYEPSLAVFVQGRKRVNMGGMTYLCDESTFLLASVDVPVVSQIFASEEVPYMAIRLGLDMQMVREIISREDLPEPAAASQARGISVGKLTPELLSACVRSRLQAIKVIERPRQSHGSAPTSTSRCAWSSWQKWRAWEPQRSITTFAP